jgi:hypothetical protein
VQEEEAEVVIVDKVQGEVVVLPGGDMSPAAAAGSSSEAAR